MKRFLLIIFILKVFFSYTQQLPPGIKWYELQTTHLRIIYPAHLKNQALYTARYIEHYHHRIVQPHSGKVKKIALILNPYTAVPNGYVGMAPRKSEWYLQPPAGLFFGGESWLKTLANHEYRHVVQIDVTNRGFVKLGQLLGGGYGQLATSFLIYPMWYFEGDAVDTETRLSQAGRGRSGGFAMPFYMITNEYDKKNLNYYKLYFGSYKRYYPSHYHTGYYLTRHIKRQYGDSIWNKIVKSAAWFPLPGGFQLSLYRNTKKTYKTLTYNVLEQFKNRDSLLTSGESLDLIKRKRKIFAHELFPVFTSPDTLLFLHYGFEKTPAIYLHDFSKGENRKIVSIPAYYFSANKKYIAWTEFRPDTRWSDRIYSRVRVFDRQTGKQFYLTGAGKYQSPVLSKTDEDILAVVRYDLDLIPHLEVWQVPRQEKIKDLVFPQFESIRHPSFVSGDSLRLIFNGLVQGQGTGTFITDTTSKKPEEIFPPVMENLNYPQLYGDYLLFQSDPSQKDVQIYSYHIPTQRRYQLTHAKYGVKTFSVWQDTLYYSVYSPGGFFMVKKKLTTDNLPVMKDWQPRKEADGIASEFPDTVSYKIKKFNHLKSYFNPHSWAYFAFPENDSVISASVNVMMNDVLDESSILWGASINSAGDRNIFARMEWRRYYPVLGLEANAVQLRNDSLHFYGIHSYIKLPLNFSSGNWSRHFTPEIKVSYFTRNGDNYFPYEFSFGFSAYRHRAFRHVGSRFAYGLSGTYTAERETVSEFKRAAGFLHLPGPGRNDYVRFHFGTEERTGNFHFGKVLRPVRGSKYFLTYRHLTSAGLTYHAPLAYPETGWFRVVYLKRLRYKLFVDLAVADGTNFQSAGLQLIGDWNLLGIKYDFPVGLQVAYVRPFDRWTFNLVIMNIIL